MDSRLSLEVSPVPAAFAALRALRGRVVVRPLLPVAGLLPLVLRDLTL